MPRNYAREYALFHGKAAEIAKRASRNAARKKLTKVVGKAKLAGKDVGHANHNPKDNRLVNLRVESVTANRARKTKGRKR